MMHEVVVISANCASTKQCTLLLMRKRSSYDAGFFQLTAATIVATSFQCKLWCTARILFQ